MAKAKNNPVAVVFTDLHLIESTVDTCHGIIDQAIQACLTNGVKIIISGGDIFTYRKGMTQEIGLAFVRMLDKIHDADLKLYTIVGNHDKTDLEGSKSFLNFFERHPALKIIEDGWTYTTIAPGLSIGFLSYFKESSDVFKLHLGEVMGTKPDVLFTHVAVDGVRNNDGSLVQNELKKDLFKGVKYVYVGHYHNTSLVGKNIHYIGSAYQNNYGENEDKGLFLLMNDGSLDRIETIFPKYRVLRTSFSNLEMSIEKLVSDSSYKNTRLIVEDFQENLKLVDKRDLEFRYGIEVVLSEIVEEKLEDDSVQFKSFTPELLLESFDSFAVSKQLEEDEIKGCKKLMVETIKQD